MTSEDKKEIGSRLKKFAEDNYKSLAEFTRAYGKTSTFFSPYFSGKSVPGGDVLARLAELGCDINWLITGKKEPQVPSVSNFTADHVIALAGANTNKFSTDLNNKFEKIAEELKELKAENYDFRKENKMLNQKIENLQKQHNQLAEKNSQMLETIESLYNGLDKNLPVALALEKLLNMYRAG